MARARHEEIQKIERDFVELAQMFEDLDALVVQQDASTQQIEQAGEEVNANVVKANEEIKGAIEKARSRNRKKWWCLLICREYLRVEDTAQQADPVLPPPHYRRCCDRGRHVVIMNRKSVKLISLFYSYHYHYYCHRDRARRCSPQAK